MTPPEGPRFWWLVATVCSIVGSSLLLPPVIGEAVCALAVLASVALTLRSRSSVATFKYMARGCSLLAVGPVVTEVHRAFRPDDLLTVGDLVAMTGYATAIIVTHRLTRLRTVDWQPQVMIDALAAAAWAALAIGYFTVEDVLDALDGFEVVASLAYLPLTLSLVFVAVRLGLGSGERTGAFGLLAAAVVFAAVSEIGFLEGAVGSDVGRRIGVVGSSLAIVSFAAAFFHTSAADLETPPPPRVDRTSTLQVAVIGASTVAIVLIAALVESRSFEVVILGAIALAMAARMVVVVRERDEWLRLQRVVSEYAASVGDVQDANQAIGLGLAAVDDLLIRKRHTFAEVVREQDIDPGFETPDPSGVEANEIDGDLFRALQRGRSIRTESLAGAGSRRHQSRLVVPLDAGPSRRWVLLVEASPVLSSTEVFHVELLAQAVVSAVLTAEARRRRLDEKADRRFRALVQDSSDVVMLVDENTLEVKLVSPTVERLLGYDEAECLGAHALQHAVLDDGAAHLFTLEKIATSGTPVDIRLNHKNGQVRWFAVTARHLHEDDELDGVIVNLADIHQRKMFELQVGTSERRYRGLVETAQDIFAMVDEDLEFTFVSPNVETLLLRRPGDLMGVSVVDLVALDSLEDARELIDLPREGADGRTAEIQLVNGEGTARWFEVSITDGSHTGSDGWIITARDVHVRREMQKSMEAVTLYDPLTGLFNRATLQFKGTQRIQEMETGESVGLIQLDVRDFSVVNESLGFEVGDELLVAIANRIATRLRGEDLLARLGADQFAVMAGAESLVDLVDLATHIEGMFAEPFCTAGRDWQVSVSIGIAHTTSRRDTAVQLLEQAAIACRQAKSAERSAPVIFEPYMREVAHERFELESDLLPGLARGEFYAVYQPLFDLQRQRVRSVEALLRWNHPERGFVSPGRFIPVAEHTGAIVELGRWVLAESCRQLDTWHRELPDGDGLGVGVNMSVRQLVHPGEFERLTDIILDSGVDPSRLTLELTESLVINEVPTVREGIEALRELGITIAVDDFGSGTAGLNHLRDVPFDILKIDKSYVDPLAADHESYQLLASVIELAHSMDAKVVAEGIETPEQATLLRQMGCDIGQGFYLARPMGSDDLEEWFAAGRAGTMAAQIIELPAG